MNILICGLAALALGQNLTTFDSDFETALGTAGLTTRTARFDENLLRFFRSGEHMTPIYAACSENPWRVPAFAASVRNELSTTGGRPSDSLSVLARQLGFQVRRTLLGNPNQAEEDRAKKPGALQAILGRYKSLNLIKEVPNLDVVPADTQKAAALILDVLLRVREYRRLAFQRCGNLDALYARLSTAPPDPESTDFDLLLPLYRNVDFGYLYAGGHDLLLACQAASAYVSTVPETQQYSLRIETSMGDVVLAGGSNETYGDNRPTLLHINTGGNDTYVNPARNASASNWASILIDSAGGDRYVSDLELRETAIAKWSKRKGANAPGPCSALFGYAVLIDTEGYDLYRSHRPGLASARFGVAALLDKEGDDVYDAYANGEGFADGGIAVLEDLAGKDSYAGFTQVQGVGLTLGAGMLLDRTGDDTYLANDEVVDFPSAQSAQHNNSMSQGAGYGRRADYLDSHSLAGGLGILYDVEGNDRYSCGVFGQGVGYWEGVGFLWDGGGADTYQGQWYVQGAAAHFSVGYLEDLGGDDKYSALMNMAQGAGHDFSLGFLIDHAGSDSYTAPNLSLGAGNANGIGVFIDVVGDDTYNSAGITLGRAAEAPKGSLRATALTLGLFMDLAGRDTYPASANWAKDAVRVANWTDKTLRPEESQLGIFYDRP
jgi:hypothetical protein